MKHLPNFKYEQVLWSKGHTLVAGLDEVGRGCLAGPVVTGCVIFSKDFVLDESIKIDDSKKLNPLKRKEYSLWIKKNCLAYGLGQGSVSEINKYGIVGATNKAFRRAIKGTGIEIDYLLIDAFYIPFVKGLKKLNQQPIIKGDSLSVSIAAASIIAKVERDMCMSQLHKNTKYTKYGWDENKGYGTKAHRDAIRKHGVTIHHRKLFVRNLSLD